MTATTVTFEQLRGLAGTDLGTSSWLTVGQERVDQFADATEDHQWIHVDPVKSLDGPFGMTVAHGYLTLSLLPRLLKDVLVVIDQVRGTNYGLDRCRFTSPLPVGSEVRLSARLLTVSERPDGALQYTVAAEMQVRGSDRPALVAEAIYLSYSS